MAFTDFLTAGTNVLGGILGATGAAKAQKHVAQAQIKQRQRELEARQKSYQEMLNRARGFQAGGEQEFMETLSAAPEELGALERDIAAGGTEAMEAARGQIQAGLAQQGVRGGQAATQLRRGVGELGIGAQRDITKLKAEDALRRKAQQAAYQQAKTLAGQQGLLSVV